jgi:hypothetical protein
MYNVHEQGHDLLHYSFILINLLKSTLKLVSPQNVDFAHFQGKIAFKYSLWLSAFYVMPLLHQNSMLSYKMDVVCSNYIMMNILCEIRNNR